MISKSDENVGTCTLGGCGAPVSLGRTAQSSSPSELIARLTAVQHFLPRGKVVRVPWGVLTVQDFWRGPTCWGKSSKYLSGLRKHLLLESNPPKELETHN